MSAINEKTAMGQTGPSHCLMVVILFLQTCLRPVPGRIVVMVQEYDSGVWQRLHGGGINGEAGTFYDFL
jgi:hypothetical protein